MEIKTQKKISKLLSFWKRYLGLVYWKVEVVYKDYLEPGNSAFTPSARTFADWRYLDASIEFSASHVEKMDDDELEKLVVHELLHLVVNELRESEISHEERVVSELTNAAIWLRNYEPQKTTKKVRETRGEKANG